MPILTIRDQQGLRQAGVIRMGEKVRVPGQDRNGNDKFRPSKLEKFRITTRDLELARNIARLYGGEALPWEDQYQVYITADEIPVLVAPNLVQQWYEQWKGGECTHRCDGEHNGITGKPCSCVNDPKKRACKATTRVWFLLPEIAELGTFKLESHGYYAAVELAKSIEMIREAQGYGVHIPCMLALEPRSTVENGQTIRYAVPVLRMRMPLNKILSIAGQERPALDAGQVPALTTSAPALPASTPQMSEAAKGLTAEAVDYLTKIGMTKDQREAYKQDCIKDRRSWSKFALQARDASVWELADFRAYYLEQVTRTEDAEAPEIPSPTDWMRSIKLDENQIDTFISFCNDLEQSWQEVAENARLAGVANVVEFINFYQSGVTPPRSEITPPATVDTTTDPFQAPEQESLL